MKITKQGIIERLVFIGIFSGMLFPLRYIFNTYFSHYWFGAVGVVTVITFSLYYFSKKGKLGKIGTIISKRLEKRSKGKIGLTVIIILIFGIYIESLFVIGIIYADQDQVKQVTTILNKQGIHDLNSLQNSNQNKIHNPPLFFLYAIEILFTPNQISFTLVHVLNNLSNNYIFPLFTILLVEDIEVLGLILFFRIKRS